MPDFLTDINPKGKERPWAERKQKNLFLADVFDRNLMQNVAFKVRNCGTMLTFRKYEDGQMQLKDANFCKVRLCPLCNWRRSVLIYGQVSKIMDWFEKQYDYRYVFVTLTVKNCEALELSKTIRKLLTDFHNLVRLKDMSCFKGFIRVLEVTYSKSRDDYHPHIHAIFAVNKSYFNAREYISHKQLVGMWRSVCGLDYDPKVNIQKVVDRKTGKDDAQGRKGAVCEIAKYTVKDSDYLDIYKDKQKKQLDLYRIDRVVDTLYRALNGIRLLGLGGCFKAGKDALKLQDAEDGKLCDDDELRPDVKYVIEKYQWRAGLNNYVLYETVHNVDIICDDED